MLEEEIAGAAAIRFVLRQYRKSEDAAANRAELIVSQIVLSENDVVRDMRRDPQLKLGIELLFEHAEECPEFSIWSSAAATFTPSKAQPDPATGLHSLRLVADNAEAHGRWIQVLGDSIARLIVQSHKHYANNSPFERRRVVPSDVVESQRGLAMPPQHPIRDGRTSPAHAKVTPFAGYRNGHDVAPGPSDNKRSYDHLHRHSSNAFDAECQGTSIEGVDKTGSDMRSDTATSDLQRRDGSAVYCPSESSESSEYETKEDNNYLTESEDGNQSEDNQQEDEHQESQAERLRECHDSFDSTDSSLTPPGGSEPLLSPEDTGSATEQQLMAEVLAFTPSPNSQIGCEKVAPASSQAMPSTSEARAYDDEDAQKRRSSRFGSSGVSGVANADRSAVSNARFRRSNPSVYPFHSQTHTFDAGGQVFTLDTRYRLLKSVGTGAYGAVIAVKDSVADMNVAVKKITNIFEDLVDAKRILREIRLLRHFDHKNITKLLDLSPPRSKKQFEDMYIITELMETDLHQVIYSMQPMSDDHVKYFLYQMLCALHHIHSAGVLHRDMKPSNILLNSNCDLKICDFGLARGGLNTAARNPELTEYVVTRWYRAPEIMLNCLHYSEAIDVWAVGCIFAEMLLREPLFPGNDYIHQLKLIIKFLGTPKQEDISFVKNVKALRFLAKLSISKPKKWRDVFSGVDVNPQAIDLLQQMLMFNPAKRISVEDALRHPYLETFYDQVDISVCPRFDFSFDLADDQLSKEALIDLLCEDIEYFHPSVPFTGPPVAASSRFFRMGMTASAS